MTRRRLAIAWSAILLVAVCALATVACSGTHDRHNLSESTPLTERVLARPARQGDLTAVSVDIDVDVASPQGGSLRVDLRRASLGTTRGSYEWDWKGATPANISFVDLTKRVQQHGVVRAWDVEVSTPAKLRLKVWRDWDSEWRVVSQSPEVSAAPGLNHFVLTPALSISAGDYVGLFVSSGLVRLTSPFPFGVMPDLRDQSTTSLAWSSARGFQYNFPGDVACGAKAGAQLAPNPGYSFKIHLGAAPAPEVVPDQGRPAAHPELSVVDLEKVIPEDAVLRAWDVAIDAPGTVRLKVWRPEAGSWRVVGQSRVERATAGLNRFALDPPLPVRASDRLGFLTDWPPPGIFPVQVDACTRTPSGKLYVSGDFTGSTLEAAMSRDGVGSYAFRARGDAGEPPIASVTLAVQPGRRVYRLPIPPQSFAVDEEVDLIINAQPGTHAFVSSVGGRLSGRAWLAPEYAGLSTQPPRGLGNTSSPWSIANMLLLVVAAAGWWSLNKRQVDRRALAWAAAALVAATAIWLSWISGTPLAVLAPGIVVMLVLPGFLVLELAAPALASRLDPFERAPLLFSLSMTVWTLLAIVAYRAQWHATIVISVLLVLGFAGLAIVFWRQLAVSRRPLEDAATRSAPGSDRMYRYGLVALLLVVMAAVAWRAQFQGIASDTIAHLAGYRKAADAAQIVGGNPLLGPGYAYVGHYASNAWYLAFGLTARMAHAPASVPLLYVCLSALLTGLSFLAFYTLLRAFTSDARAAVLGTLIVIAPWMLEYIQEWKSIHSYFYDFMAYQSTFTQLLVFPVLTAFVLHFVRDGRGAAGIVVALLSIAAMGMHAQYLVWVPLVIGAGLVVVMLLPSGKGLRLQTTALVAFIACAALVLGYLTTTFPSADKPAEWKMDQEIGLWVHAVGSHGLWRPTATIMGEDPIYIFDHKAEIVGLVILLVLGTHRVVMGKTSVWLKRAGESMGNRRLAVAAATILSVPLLVMFNPLLATAFFMLLHTAVPIYRLPGANAVLTHVAVYGAAAVAWNAVIQACQGRPARRWAHAVPLAGLAIAACIVLVSPSGRRDIFGPLANHSWFPSLLDLPNDRLYRGLSGLAPGVVAVSTEEAELVAALTPHHVVLVRQFRIGDSTVAKQRADDNDAILSFSLPADQMREVLRRVNCRYVVVPTGSPSIASFRRHPQLFSEAFAADANVVFAVRGL